MDSMTSEEESHSILISPSVDLVYELYYSKDFMKHINILSSIFAVYVNVR